MAQGDVFQATIEYAYPGKLMANVLAFRQTDILALGDPVDGLRMALEEDIFPELCNCFAIDGYISALRLNQLVGGSAQDEVIYPQTFVGTLTGECLPYQNASLLSVKTGLAGRSNRGRIYLPPPTEGVTSGQGVLNAGFVTQLQTFADLLFSFSSSTTFLSDWQIGIWQRTLEAFVPATAIQVQPIFASQRKRRRVG